MKNKEVVSAVVGSTFFAIPYLSLSVALVPSLLIGCAAFGASQLVLSKDKEEEIKISTKNNMKKKIDKAKDERNIIAKLIPKVEKTSTKDNLKEICNTIDKIIEVASDKNLSSDTLKNFFDYYLPILVKISVKYEEIEDKDLISKEGSTFITKADKMIKETNQAFKTILSSLYKDDLLDADAEMKVYDLMLKADGIVGDNLLMKGSGDNEE